MNRKTDTWKWKKYHIFTLFFVLLALISLGGSVSGLDGEEDIKNTDTINEIEEKTQTEPDYTWMKIPMEDAINERDFTFEEYAKTGSPVVIHIFAIWCSICTMQLKESTTFQETYPDKANIIGIDVDDTESKMSVAQHVSRNEVTGTFAAAPKEVSTGLVNTFGPLVVVQIPQTIIIVDKDIFYIGPGLVTANALAKIIDEIQDTRAESLSESGSE
jgi:thiol-disulfide isomerase/thioredoxin